MGVTAKQAPSEAEMSELLGQLRGLLGPDVEKQLVTGGEEGLTKRTLTRWLVARKLDVHRAAHDLTAHAAWRIQQVPHGLIAESEVQHDLSMNKGFAPGWDRDGHPTLVARVRCHHHSPEFRHFMLYVLDLGVLMGEMWEKRTGKTWDGKLVGILDLQNISLANCDTSGLLIIFDVLQHHYVERLHKLYLYMSPAIFYGAWAVVRPFLDPVTRQKVQFVYKKDADEIFSRDYDPGVLPAELGGTAPEIPFQEMRARMLAERDAAKQTKQTANGATANGTTAPTTDSQAVPSTAADA